VDPQSQQERFPIGGIWLDIAEEGGTPRWYECLDAFIGVRGGVNVDWSEHTVVPVDGGHISKLELVAKKLPRSDGTPESDLELQAIVVAYVTFNEQESYTERTTLDDQPARNRPSYPNVRELLPKLESYLVVSETWRNYSGTRRDADAKIEIEQRFREGLPKTDGHIPEVLTRAPWKRLLGLYKSSWTKAKLNELKWVDWDSAWCLVGEEPDGKKVLARLSSKGEYRELKGIEKALLEGLDVLVPGLGNRVKLGTQESDIFLEAWWQLSENRAALLVNCHWLSFEDRSLLQVALGRTPSKTDTSESKNELPTDRVHDGYLLVLLDTATPENVRMLSVDSVPSLTTMDDPAWLMPVAGNSWVCFTAWQSIQAVTIDDARIRIEPLYKPMQAVSPYYLHSRGHEGQFSRVEQYKGQSVPPSPNLGLTEDRYARAARAMTSAWCDNAAYLSGLVPSVVVVRRASEPNPWCKEWPRLPWEEPKEVAGWPKVDLREFVLPAGCGAVGALFPVNVSGHSGVIAVASHFGIGAVQPSGDWSYRAYLVIPDLELTVRIPLAARAKNLWARRGYPWGKFGEQSFGFTYGEDILTSGSGELTRNRATLHTYRGSTMVLRLVGEQGRVIR